MNDQMSEKQASRIISEHATRIIKIIEHLEPALALSSIESAFISLIYHCVMPEKRGSALDTFIKHSNKFFELEDQKESAAIERERIESKNGD